MKQGDARHWSYSRHVFLTIGLFVSILAPTFNLAYGDNENPQVLMVVGYDGEAWYPYLKVLSGRDEWKKIETIRDPAYLTRQPRTGNLFVKGNDGRLYRYQSSNKSLSPFPLIDGAEQNNYTQLRAAEKGVALVTLLDGKSRDTQLVYYDARSDEATSSDQAVKNLIKQESAQFHPYIHENSLYYAYVTCRTACRPVIQDVWRHDLVTGKTQQLTMLNSTSYLHSVDNQERFGFISSNYRGFYHIAQLNLADLSITWMTDGQVTDSFPSVSQEGHVYFMRRTASGTDLMLLEKPREAKTKQLRQIELPVGVKKIRYLELTD